MPDFRLEILADASKATGGERNQAYGPPTINMDNIADLWNAYLRGRKESDAVSYVALTGEDVAWMMVLTKMARAFGSFHPDNYVDAAAYSAIAGECRQDWEKDE